MGEKTYMKVYVLIMVYMDHMQAIGAYSCREAAQTAIRRSIAKYFPEADPRDIWWDDGCTYAKYRGYATWEIFETMYDKGETSDS